jgi:hypothetical protein
MVVGKDGKPITIRFPDGLAEELAVAASENGRSRNTEIVLRLKKSLGKAAKASKQQRSAA